MKKLMFSIIVPVYNVEKYLSECIKSIEGQTFKDYELILIDDGSNDSSGDICEKNRFQKNIKVIHQENRGLSAARNTGIALSKGEYLIFLDSDDYWSNCNFLYNINKVLVINDYDLIIINSKKYYENTKKFSNDRFDYSFGEIAKKESIKRNIYKACAWDKVIKASIIKDNEFLFPLNMLSEDIAWAGNLLSKINKIYVYNDVVYVYRQRTNSISKTIKEKNILDIYNQIAKNVMKEKNETILSYYAYEYSILLAYSKIANKSMKEKIKKLSYLLNYGLSSKVKLVNKFYKIFGFTLTSKVLNFYINEKGR